MRIYKDKTWEWIETKSSQGPPFNGNYCFFSSNRIALKRIAEQEITHHNFTCTTVLLDPDEKRGKYMLCIYDSDNRREGELAMRYADDKCIEYTGCIGKAVEMKEFFHKMCVEKRELF